jgi:hypothetical protein
MISDDGGLLGGKRQTNQTNKSSVHEKAESVNVQLRKRFPAVGKNIADFERMKKRADKVSEEVRMENFQQTLRTDMDSLTVYSTSNRSRQVRGKRTQQANKQKLQQDKLRCVEYSDFK